MVSNGDGAFIKTFRSVADAVKPGMCVSGTGGTQGTAEFADAADDVTVGVVLEMPNQDIDTAYAVGASFPVALCSSGAEVWVRYKTNGGALAAGSFVQNTDAEANGLSELGAEGLYETFGRSLHMRDNIASESWALVRLNV